MAGKKRKSGGKKSGKKIKPILPDVSKLEHDLRSLSSTDMLGVISRALNASLDTDNHGQIIIYTDLMYDGYDKDAEVIPFEMECIKDHVEYEEEHECEL